MKQSVLIAAIACSMAFAGSEEMMQEKLAVSIDGETIINTLPDQFFGHNYWMWCETWGNNIAGTESTIAELKLGLLRLGGISVDVDYPDRVTREVLSDYYAYCEAVGAQPLVQVQLANATTTEDRVANALEMVSYVKTLGDLTYVSIGNEPDLYPDNLATNADYGVEYLSSYTLDDYCTDFNAVAAALKQEYPDLKIIGLELSHKYSEWVPEFISRCKEHVDVVSLHYYPNTANACRYRHVRDDVSSMQTFYETARSLIDQNAEGKEIPLIIGETNISWDGDPANSTYDASPGTFSAGLWVGDLVGVSSAQQNLLSIMPWSIREGWTLGFLDASRDPRPVYHIYKMFSTHAKKQMIHNEELNSFVRVYGYKDDDNNVSLFTINWDTTASYTAEFSFSHLLADSTFSYTIPAHSISCLTFPADFAQAPQIIEYTAAMEEPVSIKRIRTGALVHRAKALTAVFDGKRNRVNISAARSYDDVTMEIVNVRGQIIHAADIGTIPKATSSFAIPGKQLAQGIYTLRLLTGQKELFTGKL
ncbi:MAG: hypothetical protein ACLFSB_16475 [Chitinispirillaceae bacterium]